MAATSTDAALRRMGRGVATAAPRGVRGGRLALLHFAMQEKVDVTEPVLMAGLFCGWPLSLVAPRGGAPGWRCCWGWPPARRRRRGIEAGWYAAATGVDARRVLAANLDVGFGLRPALWVGLPGSGQWCCDWRRGRGGGAPCAGAD